MLTPGGVLVEVAVDGVASALAAAELGAGRIELCQALNVGGLTPSPGLLCEVRTRLSIPIFVMIRVGSGSFEVGAAELGVMLHDVAVAKANGADGIVTGVLDGAAEIDRDALKRIVEQAHPLPVTFHRAFDEMVDQAAGLNVLSAMGVRRVLTSGGARTALDGLSRIAALAGKVAPPLAVLPGGGITGPQVADLVRRTGVREIHISGVRYGADTGALGFGPRSEPDRDRVAAVVTAARRV